jgi:hypothetical protein
MQPPLLQCVAAVFANKLWVCALLMQVADCQVKLQRADKLIGGLSGERTRWSATVEQLQQDLDNLVGDVVLAAGKSRMQDSS